MGWSNPMRLFALATVATLGIAPLVGCQGQSNPNPSVPWGGPTAAPSVVATAPGTPETPTTSTTYTPPSPLAPVKDPVLIPLPATPLAKDMRARPISGGTLTVLSDGHTAVAADSDRDLVYVVDLGGNKLSSTIALHPGDEPGRVVEDGAGLVHVALRSGGAVATIDPVAGTIVARRALCAAPRGLAVDKTAGLLHVACAGGELVSIAATPSTLVPTRTVILDRDLRDVAVSTGGRLLVSSFRSADVALIAADGSISSHLKPNQDFQGRASGVAWRMVSRSDGSALVLHETNTPSALSIQPGGYGQSFGCGSIVTSTVTVVAPDSSAPNASMPFAETLVGADLALAPDGEHIAVVSIAGADQGNQVQFFDIDNGQTFNGGSCWQQSDTPSTSVDDGSGSADASGSLAAPDTYLPPNGEIVAVAYDQRGNVIVQSREPATIQVLTQRLPAVTLSTDSRFDAGHQLFHTATTAQVACVSCHPEGGEDGRVWQFQVLGERRTQSLRGGIMDTAPFHWGGEEPNMTMLMTDVFQGRMAGAQVDTQRVSALSAWLNQIPTIPTAAPADVATLIRGQTLFASAGCTTCHTGSDFTNNQTVDVGTGGAFQVPQMHGLAMRAPYMHNGCAPTLLDRFSSPCGGGATHGNAASLSSAQLTDLVAYLETL
jgi:mono/diheme cytochrome c family protein